MMKGITKTKLKDKPQTERIHNKYLGISNIDKKKHKNKLENI